MRARSDNRLLFVLMTLTTVVGEQDRALAQPDALADKTAFTPIQTLRAAQLAPSLDATRVDSPAGSVRRRPRFTMDPEWLRTAKARAQEAFERRTSQRPAAAEGDIAPTAVPLQNQPGLRALDVSPPVLSPPDATGAIGPRHYLELVNRAVRIYDRNLQAASVIVQLDNFVGLPGFEMQDPQILWDQDGQRWFYTVFVTDPTDPASTALSIGWSRTDDPTAVWCRYAFATGRNEQDSPKLGHNEKFLFIGTNQIDSVTKAFLTAQVWAIEKPPRDATECAPFAEASLFYSQASPMRNEDGTMAFAPVPANVTDPNSLFPFSECFIVASHYQTPSNKIMIWRGRTRPLIGDPIIIPDGDVMVATYDIAPGVPQPVTPFPLDTGDARLLQAIAHIDPDAPGTQWAVWTQHTIAGGGGSVARWYEFVHITTGQNLVRQQGEIQSFTDFIFNAAISPSSAGNDAVIFYNRASSTLSPVIAAQSRQSGTPLGTMDFGELVLAQSVDPVVDYTCTQPPSFACSWGDYAGATPDPAFPNVVWGSNQFSGAMHPDDPTWGTQNFAVGTASAP